MYETVMVAGNMGMRAELDRKAEGMRVCNIPIWHIGLITMRGITETEESVLWKKD